MANGGYVIEVLILKLKAKAEVTAALLGSEFHIKRINDTLVDTAFTHTMHIGFVDQQVPNYWTEVAHLWLQAVTKCEELNGKPLPEHIKGNTEALKLNIFP